MITINHYLNHRVTCLKKNYFTANHVCKQAPECLVHIIKIKSIFFLLSLKCMFNFIDYETFRMETVI